MRLLFACLGVAFGVAIIFFARDVTLDFHPFFSCLPYIHMRERDPPSHHPIWIWNAAAVSMHTKPRKYLNEAILF